MAVGRTQFRDVEALQKYWDWTREDIVRELYRRFHGHERGIEKPNHVHQDTIDEIAAFFDISFPARVMFKRDKRQYIREVHPQLDGSKGGVYFRKDELRELIASVDRGDIFDGD